MHFLIDACLPRDFDILLKCSGHDATDVRAIGMGQADDSDIAAHARANQLCILTEDWGFADIRRYPPADYFGIAVFETADAGIDEKLAALTYLLEQSELVASLPGRLVIVTNTRIRMRPPL